jgi:hypothetical protein
MIEGGFPVAADKAFAAPASSALKQTTSVTETHRAILQFGLETALVLQFHCAFQKLTFFSSRLS